MKGKKRMTDEEINDLVFDIEEIVCEPGHIIEPAGRGCGYGITSKGEQELTIFLKSRLQTKTKTETI